MKKALFATVAAAAALTVASPASAAVVVVSGAGTVQPAENVLTNTDQTGASVVGFTNQSNTSVSVTSSSDTLTTTASNGQARFASTDGSLDAATISLTGGGTFTEGEFNLFNALDDTTSVSIFANGVLQNTFTLGNGSNWFDFLATGSDAFASIGFDTNGSGVVDLRQVRIGGISTGAVPEPATWAMMLLGFGGIGFSMRRRARRTNALMQVA